MKEKLLFLCTVICAALFVAAPSIADDVELWLDSTGAADAFVLRDSEGTRLVETTADGHTGYGCDAGTAVLTLSGGLDADTIGLSGDLTVDGAVTGGSFAGDGNALTNLNVSWEQVSDKPTTLVIENRTDDPVAPETGRIWLRTDI